MVEMILALSIPITAILSSYFTLKAYSLGLKHNIAISKDKPIETKIIEVAKKNEKQHDNSTYSEIINEWLNGEVNENG